MYKKNLSVALMAMIAAVVSSCSSESGVSCARVKNGSFNVSPTVIEVSFEGNDDVNSYKVEAGPSGFVQGSGVSQITSNTYVSIPNLTPSTTYDVYVTSICSAEEQSQAFKMSSITTNPSECTGTASLAFSQYDPTSIELTCSYSVGGSTPKKYDVEYGLHGFALGSGTKVSTGEFQSNITINGVQPNVLYDFYVRANCWATDTSAYNKIEYTTLEQCPRPIGLTTNNVSGSCNSGMGETRAFGWSYPYAGATSFTISFVTISNINNPDTGNTFQVSGMSAAYSGMYCNWKAFYVKANCGASSSSSWAGPYYFN